MAVSLTLYDHTVKLLLNKEVTFTTLKAKMLDNTASFVASQTTIAAVDGSGAKEVSGNGWPAGGYLLTGVVVTQITTNDAIFDADDIDQLASGGSIGPGYAICVYDATSNKPLGYLDFGQAQSAGDTTQFKVVWHVDGMAKFSYS